MIVGVVIVDCYVYEVMMFGRYNVDVIKFEFDLGYDWF